MSLNVYCVTNFFFLKRATNKYLFFFFKMKNNYKHYLVTKIATNQFITFH